MDVRQQGVWTLGWFNVIGYNLHPQIIFVAQCDSVHNVGWILGQKPEMISTLWHAKGKWQQHPKISQTGQKITLRTAFITKANLNRTEPGKDKTYDRDMWRSRPSTHWQALFFLLNNTIKRAINLLCSHFLLTQDYRHYIAWRDCPSRLFEKLNVVKDADPPKPFKGN